MISIWIDWGFILLLFKKRCQPSEWVFSPGKVAVKCFEEQISINKYRCSNTIVKEPPVVVDIFPGQFNGFLVNGFSWAFIVSADIWRTFHLCSEFIHNSLSICVLLFSQESSLCPGRQNRIHQGGKCRSHTCFLCHWRPINE